MGIYDRDYYRKEGPSFLGSLAETGRVTTWLIGINVAFFILQFVTRAPVRGGWVEPVTRALELDPEQVLRGQVWRLGTYAFLHSTLDIWHIVLNMLTLFFFGRLVEERLGGREYLTFYLVAAVMGGLAYFLACLAGFHPPPANDPRVYVPCVGASGAVMAVLMLAACLNPRQVVLLFFVLPVPIWALAVVYGLMDLVPFLRLASGQIATSAHLGGAAFGFLYYSQGWRLTNWGARWPRWAGRSSRPQLRLYREDEDEPAPVHVTARPAPRAGEDEQLEAQLDAILAKIPRVGMEGLTEGERQVLRKASEAAKRRRS
jgi:rhomboid family protein